MKLFKLSNKFAKDESGAVTVDWVVLTAALVGIAVTLISTVRGGILTASSSIDSELKSAYTKGGSTAGGSTGGSTGGATT